MSNQEALRNQLYQDALLHIRNGDCAGAKGILEFIIRNYGDWERGAIHQSLGNCYEDLGEIDKARSAYIEALRREPGNPYFVDTFSAFVRVHGSSQEFFLWELASAQLAHENGQTFDTKRRTQLIMLGEELGKPPTQTEKLMAEPYRPPF